MELTEKYLDHLTLIAALWIAKPNKEIISIDNEGIFVQKSKTYLNKYHVHIIVKEDAYQYMETFAEGWQNRYPKAVMTKATERVEAYDLTFIKAEEKKKGFVNLKFIGELIK